MAAGYGEQINNRLTWWFTTLFGEKPWQIKKSSGRFRKTMKSRMERREARREPERTPTYGKYSGHEF